MDAPPFSLANSDPPPFAVTNGLGRAPVLLTCEHGGRALPRALSAFAPGADDMGRHIAYDVGAAEVARGLAARLHAPLVLQPYSRLLIDCNRPRHARDLAPAVSDGSRIAFNEGLDETHVHARWQQVHQPFHRAVSRLLDARGPGALIAVHSFTPRMRDGAPRRMMVGLLARTDLALAESLRAAMLAEQPDLAVELNAPYRIEDDSDYTIPVHGEPRGLPHVLLEIRNDLISEPAGVARWTDLLVRALGTALGQLRLEDRHAWTSTP